MAILEMNRISIFGLHSDRKAILEELHKKEIVEIHRPSSEGLRFLENAKSIARFDKYLSSAETAISILDEYIPEKSPLIASRRMLPVEEYHMESNDNAAILRIIDHIVDICNKIQDYKERINRITAEKTESETAKAKLEQGIEKCISEIKENNRHRRDIELFYDHVSLRRDKYDILSKIGIMEYTFVIEGYTPKKYVNGIKELLESKYAAYVEFSEPEEREDVPVAFSNSLFSSPVEGITETYSMPSATDIDPNPVMAFFYYLFFGMMFSDAGYGLLMMIGCGILGFGKRLEKPKRRNYKMFFFCGVSTVFWGLIYGGFFGNIVYTVSTSFFGKEITLAPIWLDPISQAMDLLIFSIAAGLCQILVGMGIKFYMLCRQRRVIDAICDVGFWMIILLSIGSLAAGIALPTPLMTSVGTWGAVLGAAGLLITGGRKSKNVFGKIFGGIAGIYNITRYVSDALSYCRLMALALATTAIANVVNMLAAMCGNSVLGTVLFIIIIIFGHSLNFAMNMLGAYVHTNRLQYVEFFSKFYKGGGRRFEPFRMNTKYCYFSD